MPSSSRTATSAQHRGQYAERNALFLPLVHRADISVSQDFYFNIAGRRNTFQFRMDIDNFTNLLNDNWGVGQRLVFSSTSPPVNSQPLTFPTAAQGGPIRRARPCAVPGCGPDQRRAARRRRLEQTAGIADVYRIMFSSRYTF